MQRRRRGSVHGGSSGRRHRRCGPRLGLVLRGQNSRRMDRPRVRHVPSASCATARGDRGCGRNYAARRRRAADCVADAAPRYCGMRLDRGDLPGGERGSGQRPRLGDLSAARSCASGADPIHHRSDRDSWHRIISASVRAPAGRTRQSSRRSGRPGRDEPPRSLAAGLHHTWWRSGRRGLGPAAHPGRPSPAGL